MHAQPWYTRPWGLALIAFGAFVALTGLVWSPHVRLFERSVGLAREAEPLAGFTSLLVAVVALAAWGLSYKVYKQRKRADERTEWWRRVQDGVALVTGPDETFRASGFRLLKALGEESAVQLEDVELLRQLILDLQDDVRAPYKLVSPPERAERRIASYMSPLGEGDDQDDDR